MFYTTPGTYLPPALSRLSISTISLTSVPWIVEKASSPRRSGSVRSAASASALCLDEQHGKAAGWLSAQVFGSSCLLLAFW